MGIKFLLKKRLTKEYLSYIIPTMDKINAWLNRQRKALGSWEKVAHEMNITARHLRNVRQGRAGKNLKRIILYYATGVKP